jgi:hypothetical protein
MIVSATQRRASSASKPTPGVSALPLALVKFLAGGKTRRVARRVQMRGAAPQFELSGGPWPSRDEG